MAVTQEVDVPTFHSWLAKGLGRAVMFLEKNDAAPYRDTLLHACTHNLSYDSQCEDSRAPYLWRLIELSKDRAYFRDNILEVLRTPADGDSDRFRWKQIFGLARFFAAQDDADMKQAMYSAFERLGFEKAGDSTKALISMDGFEGFLYAASQFDIDDPDREIWEFHCLMDELEEAIGKEHAEKRCAEAALHNPKLSRLLGLLSEFRKNQEEKRSGRDNRPALSDYASVKAQIAQMTRWGNLAGWGKTASSSDFLHAANDLIAEDDAQKLFAYLLIFAGRAFPGNIDRLIALVDDDRPRIRRGAVRALGNVQHPVVRKLALAFLSSTDRGGEGIELLCNNFEKGDFKIIEQALLRSESDDACHSMGYSILRLLDTQMCREAESILLILYEKTPCSLCRSDAVEGLMHLGRLPEWMRQECISDASEEIVHLVSSPISKKNAD